jgi:hypothetical protein
MTSKNVNILVGVNKIIKEKEYMKIEGTVSRETKKARYNELIKSGMIPSETLMATDREFGEGYIS